MRLNEPSRTQLHVLVVDDSAVVREVMKQILCSDPCIQVAVAADPLIAMRKMTQRRPDVIVLDIEMPRMDGITFLRKLMAEDPVPVVVCSGLAEKGTRVAVQALQEGAVEVLAKPKLGVSDFLHESAVQFIDAVWAASTARVRQMPVVQRDSERQIPALAFAEKLELTTDKVIAIGASTGGPEALRQVLEPLPADTPGIVVVQHMPREFTRMFAEALDKTCRMQVKEAEPGDRVTPGRVLIAPGDRHLELRRSGAQYVTSLSDGPLISRHRPSVDVLFRSVAFAAGKNAVGVILTGMGNDGAAGLVEMRLAGATTIAQDETSCVVFGMPREAISNGAVQQVVPLAHIAGTISNVVRSARIVHAGCR